MDRMLLMETILTEIQEIKRGQNRLEAKIDEQARDLRKYVDARIKEFDQRITLHLSQQVVALSKKNDEQDKVIEANRIKLESLVVWAETVKARAAIVLGSLTFAGAGLGSVVSHFLSK